MTTSLHQKKTSLLLFQFNHASCSKMSLLSNSSRHKSCFSTCCYVSARLYGRIFRRFLRKRAVGLAPFLTGSFLAFLFYGLGILNCRCCLSMVIISSISVFVVFQILRRLSFAIVLSSKAVAGFYVF